MSIPRCVMGEIFYKRVYMRNMVGLVMSHLCTTPEI